MRSTLPMLTAYAPNCVRILVGPYETVYYTSPGQVGKLLGMQCFAVQKTGRGGDGWQFVHGELTVGQELSRPCQAQVFKMA